MSGTVKVSGLQMLVSRSVPENEQRIAAGIERAAADRSHFLLTPEGSLSGYYPGFDREEVASAVQRLSEMAKQAGVGLAVGTCYKELENGDEFCYNQVRIYTPDGDYLGFHAKILRCSSLWHPGTGEMTDYVEGVLRTFEWRGVRFGALICNDLWATPRWTTMPNPYLPWRLKQMGAEFILNAIHSGRDQRHRPFHESSSELWARALRLPIVQVNAAAADGGPVTATSGAINQEGDRYVATPDVGEQYFVGEVTVPVAGEFAG
jgi:predicted amidohydrolase